jgi:beta-N-acetylhexosaminidase
VTSLPLSTACGQLIIAGFDGTTLKDSFRASLARGERGGVIVFRRNLGGSLNDLAELNREIVGACPLHLPPLVSVDQEGGRVARLSAPVVRLPPMRAFGALGDADLVLRAARVLGKQLSALGFNMDFAPVLDVDTCPENPVIGDRSFSGDPQVVARLGTAYASGLQASGVMACGKHFPGHGDTNTDSHLELPRVDHPRARLDAVELAAFRDARKASFAALMTAHVVYGALDPERPATMSRLIATEVLRRELGFDGLLISDDLEMKAVADHLPIEDAAPLAVRAGCDALLVCATENTQARAHVALVHEAERDALFRERVYAAAHRGIAARRERPARPQRGEALLSGLVSEERDLLARELADRGLLS